MLCQLVCLDRRYQRMNCFNVRELQILLRGRFFADLVNDTSHHQFLNNTMIGLRFKTNDLNVINPNSLLTYQYGLNTTPFVNELSYFSANKGVIKEGTYSFITPTSVKYKILTQVNSSGSTLTSNELNTFTLTNLPFICLKIVKNAKLY